MCARHSKGDFGFGAWAACCGPGFFAFGGPRGMRRRVVRRGDLKYVILGLLDEEPMHGYEIMRRLEEESGGCYSPSPGSVYPTLQMLEDQGYVVSEQKEGKKVYRITEEGKAFLEKHSKRADDIFGRVGDLGDRFSGSEMRDVTRSFMRLAQVSFESAMRKAADPEAIAKLKDILERATREMESARSGARGGSSNRG
ncbi:MAG: PadR family transcriptional regulator [Gemmatimonadota bacterium]